MTNPNNPRDMTSPDLITDLRYAYKVLARHPNNTESLRAYEDAEAELVRRGCRVEAAGEEVHIEVDVGTELNLLARRFGGDLIRDVPVGAALDMLTPEAWDEFIQRAQAHGAQAHEDTREGAYEGTREGAYESA